MLTDCIYWFIIFPFLSIKDYSMSFVSSTHDLFFSPYLLTHLLAWSYVKTYFIWGILKYQSWYLGDLIIGRIIHLLLSKALLLLWIYNTHSLVAFLLLGRIIGILFLSLTLNILLKTQHTFISLHQDLNLKPLTIPSNPFTTWARS